MSENDTTTAPSIQRKYKILCIDDEAQVLESLKSPIENLGFEVLTLVDPLEAVKVIQSEAHKLALVLSDYKMPGITGFDLRREMLVEYRQIPFIIVSGHVTREMALSGVELKISAFIDKPFRPNELAEIIQKETKERIAQLKDEDELRLGFITDAENLLDEMEGLVLTLENDTPDPESINRIFACAHTIKGSSGFFKPDVIHKFTHKYEDYLSKYKKQPQLLDANVIGVLLKGIDIIKSLVQELRSGVQKTATIDQFLAIFASSHEGASDKPALPTNNLDGPTPPQKMSPVADKQKVDELRVSTQLLDAFMERSGELTVLRNMINKLVHAIEKENPGSRNVANLSELLSEMHKINVHMQDQIVDIRKVPLKQVIKPLTRTLRDLCVSLKKDIELKVEGDDLRIDHSLADLLGKSLIHMLRNAADHGIENPEQRQKVGKPKKGSLLIKAQETTESIIVRVSDDGRGIDHKIIRAKAVEKGLLNEAQAQALTDNEARMLIFEPGFSTATEVTDVSGRGVGTDMVMKSVLSIGGRIEIASEVRKGTEFIIHLPLPRSVLIISSLMIKSKNHTFAIPQENVERMIRLQYREEITHQIKFSEGAMFYQDDQELLPLIQLNDILFAEIDKTESIDFIQKYIIKLKGKSSSYCLLVDEFLDIEDTVVKKINSSLNRDNIFCGATFLGDGKVGLILDVDGIAERYCIRSEKTAKARLAEHEIAASQASSRTRSVLVYEVGCDHQICGSYQSQVFRLEHFSKSQIQYSGQQPVIIYRDQAMPLFFIEDLLYPGRELKKVADDISMTVIVIQKESQYIGLYVQNICDLIDVHPSACQTAQGIDGRNFWIINDRTVTEINLTELVRAC